MYYREAITKPWVIHFWMVVILGIHPIMPKPLLGNMLLFLNSLHMISHVCCTYVLMISQPVELSICAHTLMHTVDPAYLVTYMYVCSVVYFGPLTTKFSEIWVKWQQFTFKKISLKMSSTSGGYCETAPKWWNGGNHNIMVLFTVRLIFGRERHRISLSFCTSFAKTLKKILYQTYNMFSFEYTLRSLCHRLRVLQRSIYDIPLWPIWLRDICQIGNVLFG